MRRVIYRKTLSLVRYMAEYADEQEWTQFREALKPMLVFATSKMTKFKPEVYDAREKLLDEALKGARRIKAKYLGIDP